MRMNHRGNGMKFNHRGHKVHGEMVLISVSPLCPSCTLWLKINSLVFSVVEKQTKGML